MIHQILVTIHTIKQRSKSKYLITIWTVKVTQETFVTPYHVKIVKTQNLFFLADYYCLLYCYPMSSNLMSHIVLFAFQLHFVLKKWI